MEKPASSDKVFRYTSHPDVSLISQEGDYQLLHEVSRTLSDSAWESAGFSYSGKRSKRWKKRRRNDAIEFLRDEEVLPEAMSFSWITFVRWVVIPFINWYIEDMYNGQDSNRSNSSGS